MSLPYQISIGCRATSHAAATAIRSRPGKISRVQVHATGITATLSSALGIRIHASFADEMRESSAKIRCGTG